MLRQRFATRGLCADRIPRDAPATGGHAAAGLPCAFASRWSGRLQSHQRREQWAATSGHAAGLDTDAPQAVCSDERPPRREIVCGKYSPPLSGRADGVTVPDRDRLLEPMI
eukprot:s6403_g5.t1